ncbi:MAG: hypothetical protein AB4038_05450, partial [Prochloraceae cyanobacterium]
QTPVPSSRGTLSAFAHGGNPRRESGISWGNPSISSRKDRNASPTDWLGNAHQERHALSLL